MNNKKSQLSKETVKIIAVIIAIFVFFGFISSFIPSLFNKSKDLACVTSLYIEDATGLSISDYLLDLKLRCAIDDPQKVDLEDTDKSFKVMSSEMARCWYRYGEGKYDFLDGWDTSGNWCFLCGKIEFEDNSKSISYKDFVDWLGKEKYNETSNYLDYINVKYTSANGEDIQNIREEYYEFLNDDDSGAEIKEMLYILGNQIEYLDDFRLKQIDSQDKEIFVVYRYDRLNKTFSEQLSSAKTGVYAGVGLSLVTSMVVEGLTEAAIIGGTSAAAGSIVPGGGTLVGGVGGAIVGFVKGATTSVLKSGKSITKVVKISNLMKKTNNFFRISKYVKESEGIYEMIKDVLSIGKKVEIMKVAERLEEGDHFKDSLMTIVKMMDEIGIDDLSDIDKIKNIKMSNLDNIQKLYVKNTEILEKAAKSGDIAKINKNLNSISKSQITLQKIETLNEDVGKILIKLKESPSKVTDEDVVKLSDYFRTFIILGSGVSGGGVGATYNDNYNQYVDLLTKEQYYRLCGTQRGLSS